MQVSNLVWKSRRISPRRRREIESTSQRARNLNPSLLIDPANSTFDTSPSMAYLTRAALTSLIPMV